VESIEHIRLEDLPALEFCTQYISEAWAQPLEETKLRIIRYAQSDQAEFCLVAKEDGQPVGMVMNCDRTGLDTDGVYEPWLAGLYVVEAYRSRGVGKRLLQKALEVAQERGIGTMSEGLVPCTWVLTKSLWWRGMHDLAGPLLEMPMMEVIVIR
jgi:GNAT superfamily N-acetyltransferase